MTGGIDSPSALLPGEQGVRGSDQEIFPVNQDSHTPQET
ncbi:hypothetical protein GFS31_42390 (plasmid) [Leptolyngbya sp. BL0902]|nr:hypothetical protein GFS31_42390 [Leptolyngbya sp. BL0902]